MHNNDILHFIVWLKNINIFLKWSKDAGCECIFEPFIKLFPMFHKWSVILFKLVTLGLDILNFGINRICQPGHVMLNTIWGYLYIGQFGVEKSWFFVNTLLLMISILCLKMCSCSALMVFGCIIWLFLEWWIFILVIW